MFHLRIEHMGQRKSEKSQSQWRKRATLRALLRVVERRGPMRGPKTGYGDSNKKGDV
jgi:hypothetical protein